MNQITQVHNESRRLRCMRCKKLKLVKDFYTPMLKKRCKKCSRELVRNWHYKNRDKVLAERKERGKTQKEKTRYSINAKKMYSKYPEKFKARGKLRYEVKMGRIKELPCEICGSTNVQAHHDDYSKPLNVRWLCVKHHREFHRKYKTPTTQTQAELKVIGAVKKWAEENAFHILDPRGLKDFVPIDDLLSFLSQGEEGIREENI